MRTAVVFVLLVLTSSVAQAQPAIGPPPPQATYNLTAGEQRILARGEITSGEHVGGVFVGLFIGFGSGQAVQGRWTHTGWIFTVGEAASIIAIMAGVGDIDFFSQCFHDPCEEHGNDGLLTAGVIGLVGFRLWDVFDSITGPISHNDRVREIHRKMGSSQPGYYSVAPFVAPTHNGGGVAGITFRF